MNLENYFWYFNKNQGFSKKTCEDIIKHGNLQKDKLASIGKYTDKKKLSEKELLDLKTKRDSNIVWLNDQWIYHELFPFIHAANQNSKWNFEWDFAESCKFTKYKKGQYYDWHCDSFNKTYGKEKGINFEGKIRKLSVTINLSEGEEYDGGDLQFDLRNEDGPNLKSNVVTAEMAREKGAVVVFPSHIWHRVTPVTKGTRYSLVVWFLGKPFK